MYKRQALLLDPSLDFAADNLELARSKVDSSFSDSGSDNSWKSIAGFLDHNRGIIALSIIVTSFASLLFSLERFFRPILFSLSLLISCSLGVGVLFLSHDRLGASQFVAPFTAKSGAVIADSSLLVRTSSSKESPAIFKFPQGEEVHVDQITDGWVRIELPQKRIGWAPQSSLLFIDDFR